MKETNCVLAPDRILKKWIKDVSTPCYLYHEKGLKESAQALFAFFSWNVGFAAYFPIRINPNPSILQILKDAQCGVACANLSELLLAKECGFSGDQVIYQPTMLDLEAEGLASKLGAIRLIDDIHVLPPQPPEHVLLCYNPGGKLEYDGRRLFSLERVKFGMDEQGVMDMVVRMDAYGAKSIGLCMRAGENEIDPMYYPAVAQALFSLAVRVLEKTGIRVDSCHLSEGLGYSYRPEYPQPDLGDCAEQIQKLVQSILIPAGLDDLALYCAPGRYLTAAHAVLLTRVIGSKRRKKPLVLVDANCAQMMRLMMLGTYHRIEVLGRQRNEKRLVCDLAGCGDFLQDRIGEDLVLPPVSEGDILAVCDAGADGAAFWSAYGSTEPCSEYLYREDGTIVPIPTATSKPE